MPSSKTKKKEADAFLVLDRIDLDTPAGVNQALVEVAAQTSKDPLKFVQIAFPWGKDTLAGWDGPDVWQVDVLTSMRDYLQRGDEEGAISAYLDATAAGHGVGKALDVDLEVDTPTGLRRWGDLRVGDELYGPDGKPTLIVAIPYRGVRTCYRVTFDDGASTVVSGEHLWTVKGRQHRRKGLDYETLTTDEIVRRGVKRKNGKAMARQWALPRHSAVCARRKTRPTIHPYLLGLWLGNGDAQGRISLNDPEVIERMRGICEPGGVSSLPKAGTTCLSLRAYGVKHRLGRMGILEGGSEHKRFPEEVRGYSAPDRLELLCGLIDTDGEVTNHGSVVYSTVSAQLAADVLWLVRSLGGKAQISPKVKQPFYRDAAGNKVFGKPCYRLTLAMPRGVTVSYLPRKRDRIRPTLEDRYLTRWIDSIEPVGERECMCVTVDRHDGLFLANDFIVTHNSALVAWITLWSMATFPDTRGIVTANTDTQLRTKTFAEVTKWFNLCLFKSWFRISATCVCSRQKDHDKTWRFDAIPWSESRPEGFAGLHNARKRIMVIFDEASAIADIIWEVVEGAMTDKDTQIFWMVFGNPTRNTGRFYECFNKYRHRWVHRHVDGRTAIGTDKKKIATWIQDYGIDSDFVRVRVLGQFPSASSLQFIPRAIVDEAMQRQLEHCSYYRQVVILGVDVARFGDDASVICCRIGTDARSYPAKEFRGLDGWELAAKIAEVYNEFRQKGARKVVINVDAGGVGASPIDWLRHNGYPVNSINFGGGATNTERYKNLRAEMWGRGRAWLKAGGCIEQNDDLVTDLTGVEYGYTPTNQILLESKESMKDRGLSSPDRADALMLTFAVQMNEYLSEMGHAQPRNGRLGAHTVRDPYA